MRRRAHALLAVAVAVGLGVGCGEDGAPPPSGLASPADAGARLREKRSFAFDASFTRTTPGEKPEEYMAADGAVDLRRGVGRMDVDVSGVLGTLSTGEENPLAGPFPLAWDRRTLTVRVDGAAKRFPREEARDSAGVIGRMPDDVETLDDLLDSAGRTQVVGTEEVAGTYTTRLSFTVDARTAARRGFPAELYRTSERGMAGPRLRLEAWVDPEGLPRRIGYVVELEPLRAQGREVLPRRTLRATYDLRAFGRPVGGD